MDKEEKLNDSVLWLPSWYTKRLKLHNRASKLKLEKRLVFGYPLFGVGFGLLQYSGIGEILPARWLANLMQSIIPMIELAGSASPHADGARFFYSIMWIVAIAITIVLIPLSTDLHHDEMPKRISERPFAAFIFMPLFSFFLLVIYFGGSNDPKSLGNWKLFDNYATMAFYGSFVMAGVPFSLASIFLMFQHKRMIIREFLKYLIKRRG